MSKKRTRENNSGEEPSKKRKTLVLPAQIQPAYKEARRILSRLIKTRELTEFLQECSNKNISPNGLTVRLRPSSIQEDAGFMKLWEEAQHEASMKFTTLVGSYHANKLQKLAQKPEAQVVKSGEILWRTVQYQTANTATVC
ncbi:MAG: hypothetical protein N0E48_18205, partial [Candidatus Thiodiazotropha endolucinida]|nr:hypothetical protein [Candidatus Thiodiazotropha taylori]MCW4333206.1 hypothetical protein [Candidatus Thiodiazotropha endolucinida]MCW4345268.1 hypothetical protein [Candidatus Thiodiazotropha endolucinida]